MTRKYYPPVKRFKIFFVVSNELYSEIFVIHLQEKLVVVTNKKCLDIIFMVTPIVHGQDGPIKLFTNNGYLLYTHRYNSVFSSVTWCNERTFYVLLSHLFQQLFSFVTALYEVWCTIYISCNSSKATKLTHSPLKQL